jgi:hypothetical protein
MNHRILLGLAALALAVLPNAASAKAIPAGGVTIGEIQAWLQGEGYKAAVQKANDGSAYLASAADGQDFNIYFYDCKSGRCGSVQFSEGFNTKGAFNAAKMNQFNAGSRWVRAYVDKVNDPWVELDVDLTPGGSYELLDDEFAIWRERLAAFRKYINW